MGKRRRGNGQGTLFKRCQGGAWIASWYDHTGRRRTQSTRTTDRRAAERILAKHVSEAALRHEGVVDALQDRFASEDRKPLAEHVADYLGHCEHVGQAAKHIEEKDRHLKRLQEETGVQRLSDLTVKLLEQHMHNLRERGLSARTCNFARQVAVAFVSWANRTGRVASNPLTVVSKLEERKDRRRVRRPLTDAELARLLEVTEPVGRKAWYMTAAFAGLRKGDLLRLTWADIDFEQNTITVRGGKSGRVDVVPMHPQLADELRARRATSRALPTARVFPKVVANETRQRDFLKAGLAREEVVIDENGKPVMTGKRKRRPKTRIVTADDEGHEVDLHALRTTLGTNLARAGVAPQLAQRIMRHADYRTTLTHYTVLGVADTTKAIEQLPSIELDSERLAATGTTDTTSKQDICQRQQYAQQREHKTVQPNTKQCENTPDSAQIQESHKALSSKDLHGAMRDNAKECKKAGDGNRTHITSLEGWGFTIKLRPHSLSPSNIPPPQPTVKQFPPTNPNSPQTSPKRHTPLPTHTFNAPSPAASLAPPLAP